MSGNNSIASFTNSPDVREGFTESVRESARAKAFSRASFFLKQELENTDPSEQFMSSCTQSMIMVEPCPMLVNQHKNTKNGSSSVRAHSKARGRQKLFSYKNAETGHLGLLKTSSSVAADCLSVNRLSTKRSEIVQQDIRSTIKKVPVSLTASAE